MITKKQRFGGVINKKKILNYTIFFKSPYKNAQQGFVGFNCNLYILF
jgi:hypothetical protein